MASKLDVTATESAPKNMPSPLGDQEMQDTWEPGTAQQTQKTPAPSVLVTDVHNMAALQRDQEMQDTWVTVTGEKKKARERVEVYSQHKNTRERTHTCFH